MNTLVNEQEIVKSTDTTKQVVKWVLFLCCLIIFCVPGYTFFVVNTSTTNSLSQSGASVSNQLFVLFRLFGLYALTLLWLQLMLGSFRPLLQRLYGANALKMHTRLGTFTFLFSILHPLFFYGAYRLSTIEYPWWNPIGHYFGFTNYQYYGWLGQIALYLLIITALTAIFRSKPLFRRYWRLIHYGNYLVFLLALGHSYPVGTEAQLAPMKYLYWFFGLTFVAGFLYRRITPLLTQKNQTG